MIIPGLCLLGAHAGGHALAILDAQDFRIVFAFGLLVGDIGVVLDVGTKNKRTAAERD
ncbi:hypothetical protein [Herbaspirillum sp. ST 5-3]|uniref:hypothetical protein n=1 Tax=Herbaspirillum sp. ST 5-3 TaxID=2567936 RepID=UPI001455F0CC|nr:hypothetical protein [Herbaspirillum sp. ST 5-3]